MLGLGLSEKSIDNWCLYRAEIRGPYSKGPKARPPARAHLCRARSDPSLVFHTTYYCGQSKVSFQKKDSFLTIDGVDVHLSKDNDIVLS